MHPLLPSILVIFPSRPPLLPLMHRGVARHFKEREIDVDAVAECCDVLRGAGLTEANNSGRAKVVLPNAAAIHSPRSGLERRASVTTQL